MDISIIIPTLNEEESIEVCLKSIRSQKTKLNYEIIVADCQSEDKTVEIAKRYADKIVFSEQKNIGIARNTGAKFSQGKYLVFIDADTIIPENYLEKVKEKFLEDQKLLGFSSRFSFSKRDPQIIVAEKFTNSYFIFRDKIKATILPGFNTCVRKSAFNLVGGFKDVLLEDGDFSVRLKKVGKTKYFTDFFVVTSSRRLEEMGLLGTLRYYFEMDLASRNQIIKKFLTYDDYRPFRIKESALQKEFARIYKLSELRVDLTLRDYIQKKAAELSSVMKAKKLEKITKKHLIKLITKTAESITELKLVPKITKSSVDEAIKIIKERMK